MPCVSPADFERLAGPEGWTAQQGFYIYRNERLLVAGSWLGLGTGRSWTKDEAHRLARIGQTIRSISRPSDITRMISSIA